MGKRCFEIKFNSTLNGIKDIIKEALLFIQTNYPGISGGDLYDFKLMFSELLCNAVIHGNKQDFSKQVYLRIEISGEAINSIIGDEGSGFDYDRLLNEARLDKNLYNDHGRGILLVYSLADKVSFNLHGNEINFYKKVGRDGQNTYCG